MMQLEFPIFPELSETYIDTHLGEIPTSKMGITLVHEHIFNRYPFYRQAVSEAFTIEQLKRLELYNVKSIIDLTPYTSLSKYQKVLDSITNIQIICCTGFYLSKYIPSSYKKCTTEELVKRLSKQIENGLRGSRILPGILKVAGQGFRMTELEKKFFTVIGILQSIYNLPIATHSPKGAVSHLKCLIGAGAKPEHVFISHLDQGVTSERCNPEDRLIEILKILDQGAYVLFTEFGTGNNPKSKKVQIVQNILVKLKKAGYVKQLLISSDSNWRWKNGRPRLKDSQWGGTPRTYEYVFTQAIPTLKKIGFTEQDIDTMLIDNPKRLMSF